MTVGNVARVAAVLAALVAAAGSASSTSSSNQGASAVGQNGPGSTSPPAPQQMEASRALGLWRSTFGAVKIEADNSQGGISAGGLHGVWIYTRQGQEVVGYFSGSLRGNVLQFRWQEPNNPPLTGEGYLVFDLQGRQYSGRWWSDKRDRVGDWNGWRQAGVQQTRRDPGDVYGDQDDDDQPTPQQQQPQQSPYRRPQPYRQPSQQSPYQRQTSPQPQPQPQRQPTYN